jgi:hypothetical protein
MVYAPRVPRYEEQGGEGENDGGVEKCEHADDAQELK